MQVSRLKWRDRKARRAEARQRLYNRISVEWVSGRPDATDDFATVQGRSATRLGRLRQGKLSSLNAEHVWMVGKLCGQLLVIPDDDDAVAMIDELAPQNGV